MMEVRKKLERWVVREVCRGAVGFEGACKAPLLGRDHLWNEPRRDPWRGGFKSAGITPLFAERTLRTFVFLRWTGPLTGIACGRAFCRMR